jgi:DNA invertase Pin-like site-specific DNA recombinase
MAVSEISRLARSTLQVLEVSAEKNIAVHISKQNLVFTEKGDITSTIMATVLGMVAQIEREFISMRTKEALAARKAAGMELGRPKGKATKVKLDEKRSEILS